MAVEAREKGCVYSTQEINRRIIIRPGRGGMSRCASILIDTPLFEISSRENERRTISSSLSLNEAQKKLFHARDYSCEITEIDKTCIPKLG